MVLKKVAYIALNISVKLDNESDHLLFIHDKNPQETHRGGESNFP